MDIFKVFIAFVPILFLFRFFWLQGTWDFSSPARDRNCAPCTGRRNLNDWTAREFPSIVFWGGFFLFVFSWAFSCSLIRSCAAVLHTYSQQPRRPRPRADGKVSGAAPSSKSWPLWARSGISPYLHMQPSSLLVIRVVGKPPYKSNLRSAYFQRQN